MSEGDDLGHDYGLDEACTLCCWSFMTDELRRAFLKHIVEVNSICAMSDKADTYRQPQKPCCTF